MLGSGNQYRMHDARERFSDSMRTWLSRFGSVTHLLIWVTIAVFLVQLVGVMFRWNVMEDLFALSATQLRRGFIWQPLTYMFLHSTSNLLHIAFNLLVLWFIGREVEYFIGPKYFTRLYFLGGLAGAGFWLAFNFNSSVPVLGASAAVLACVIAFATLFPNRDLTVLLFFFIPVTIKAKYLAIGLVILNLFPIVTHQVTSVAHLAHLGGAFLGYVYIKALGYGVAPRWLLWWQSLRHALRPRRDRPKRRRLSPEEFMREQIDPILEKISKEGMQSLTREERKILESAKDLLQKQQR